LAAPGYFTDAVIASTIYGQNNPSARLTFTYPSKPNVDISYRDYPEFYLSGNMTNPEERGVAFPFGLGYTFSFFWYSNMTLSPREVNMNQTVSLRVAVKNKGMREGKLSVLVMSGNENEVRVLSVNKIGPLDYGETHFMSLNVPAGLVSDGKTGQHWIRVGDLMQNITIV
jgi:beta-glucosidase